MRTRVSVAALLAAGLLGAAALAGEDPATTRLEAPDATAGRMPDEQRARSRPPVRHLTTAGGGEVGVAASAQPLAAPRRPSQQTTLDWLRRRGPRKRLGRTQTCEASPQADNGEGNGDGTSGREVPNPHL